MAGKKIQNFYGWEKPIFSSIIKTDKDYKTKFHAALMYIHHELSNSDLKKETIKYLKTIDPKHNFLDIIKEIDENKFSSVGKYLYLLNHGAELPDDISSKILFNIEKIVSSHQPIINQVIDNSQNTKTPSIQDRLKDRAREVAAEIEGWLDDFIIDKKSSIKSIEDFVTLFKSNELKAPHMRYMENFFVKRSEEIKLTIQGKDKDLLEGYSNFTKPELKKLDLFYDNLLKSCTMLQEAAKVVRTPRKKKPVSMEKLVSKVKYKKEDNSLGIVSLSPVQIIGSKELWTYNTKTRKLSQYKSKDESGLSVKGTGLVNFSQDSIEKTLRKPAETLAEFKKASKVKLRTFLKDLTTVDVPCNGKLNEHIVILRVEK